MAIFYKKNIIDIQTNKKKDKNILKNDKYKF